MNTYLIHGENSLKAREKFNLLIQDFKSRGYEIVREGSENSLFSPKTVSVFEDPKIFPKQASTQDVIILCDGNAPAGLVKSLPGSVKVEKFDLPKRLFAFLDKINLESFHAIIKTEPIELVFAILGRHLRDVYWASTDPQSLGYPEWRAVKLASQAGKFKNLKGLIGRLAEIDIAAKTGTVDLATSLDLLIAAELE